MFGTGYLLDCSHPEIKVEPHHFNPVATERTRGVFTFVKQRGFKRRPRTSHHSWVITHKLQECVEEEFKSKGRPSGGNSVSDVSACSLVSATTTCNQGSRAGHRKGKRSQNVVFNRSGVFSLTSPSKVAPTISEVRSQAATGHRQVLLCPADEGQPEAQDQQGHFEAHAVSKSSGRPFQMGSANDLPVHAGTSPSMDVGREEQ